MSGGHDRNRDRERRMSKPRRGVRSRSRARAKMMTVGARLAGACAVAVMAGLALASGASAVKYYDSSVGVTSTTPALGGTFASAPRDVAVNDPGIVDGNAAANGDFYVVDDANHRIQRFNADGSFDLAWGADVIQAGKPGDAAGTNPFEVCIVAADCKAGVATGGNGATTGNGSFDNPQGIAVDQDTGSVYVSDRDNRRISQYTAEGAFVRSFGFDVDATTAGAGYEVCPATDVCKVGVGTNAGPVGQYSAGTTLNGYRLDVSKPDGNLTTGKVFLANTGSRRVEAFNLDGSSPSSFGSSAEFPSGQPLSVAVDTAGIAYALAGGTGNPIARYDTVAGQFLSRIDVAGLTGNSGARVGLEIDRMTGNLFVVSSSLSTGLFEIATPGGTPSLVGVYPTSFTASFQPIGVGVNPDTGKVFMPTSSSPTGSGTVQRVVIFDDDGLGPIDITLEPATNVQATVADLHATINPAPNGPTGQPTSYRFEVSKDGITWTQVTASTQVPPNGDTDFDQPVQAQATGLEPNSSYRVRVVATRANNSGAVTSAELSFITDPAPPEVETVAAQQVSDTTAQLIGQINPGGLATSYWFEWGDDTYGNTVPVPAGNAGSGGITRVVGETLTGLNPNRFYHFRLCARNSLVASPVCGNDRLFQTRSATSSPPGRVYEMVTSPDKVLRRGGDRGLGDGSDNSRYTAGYASTDGAKFLAYVFGGALDPDGGTNATADRGWELRSRTAEGWRGAAILNRPVAYGASAFQLEPLGISADLTTHSWLVQVPLFASGAQAATRVIGDTGGPLGTGWYPWLDPAWYGGGIPGQYTANEPVIDDDGVRGVVSNVRNSAQLRDIKGIRDPLAPNALSPPQTSGQALFASGPPSWGPLDLVNECTGSGPLATAIPVRNDAGTPGVPADDTIGDRACSAGAPTDVRGATLGGRTTRGALYLAGSHAMVMSDSGDRIFFASPDPNALPTDDSANPAPQIDEHLAACSGAAAPTGAGTTCPPQLFVRQLDDAGNPTVRWISRADAEVGTQEIAAFGDGVAFEGASRDGRVVYFRTDAPLTTDDPNGGQSIIAGPASRASWDLYRYVLPASNDDDPTGPQAGGLSRVSAGPDGDADASTNVSGGEGGVVRFVSDSGNRVYFVTTSRIGAPSESWNHAPADGATAPGGTVGNATTRNLYLYDATKSGAAAYKFIAQIPYATPINTSSLNSCGSSGSSGARSSRGFSPGVGGLDSQSQANCVHGTGSGDAVVFETTGQLTNDDTDSAGDVYMYEADRDSLTRLSAPPAGSSPYRCLGTPASPSLYCNGDLGLRDQFTQGAPEAGLAPGRHFNVGYDLSGKLRSVFFQSRLRLVGEDVNDQMDVYEWEDGALRLVSPGTTTDSAFYTGNSRDGRDVFFWTEQRISDWEIDPADGDTYNATQRPDRILDGPPPIPPICGVLAGGCHGNGPGAVAAEPRTLASPGARDANPAARKMLSIAGLSAKARRRAARTGKLALRVRTTGRGKLSAVARGKIGKRKRVVARGSTLVREPGTTTIGLRLSGVARRALRRGRELNLLIRVTQRGARSRSIAVALRRGKRS
jgi:NHL repeat